jgi:hypothetical protein
MIFKNGLEANIFIMPILSNYSNLNLLFMLSKKLLLINLKKLTLLPLNHLHNKL